MRNRFLNTNRYMRTLAGAAVSVLLILTLTSISFAGTYSTFGTYKPPKPNCGHLRGFIYKSDGETPLWGAQVVLQEVKTQRVFRSNVTDTTGDYQILDVPAGDYVLLILAQDKSYKVKRVDFLIKIIEGKTATISFSLNKSLKALAFFLLRPCCLASVISGTAVSIALITHKEKEQSPTQH